MELYGAASVLGRRRRRGRLRGSNRGSSAFGGTVSTQFSPDSIFVSGNFSEYPGSQPVLWISEEWDTGAANRSARTTPPALPGVHERWVRRSVSGPFHLSL